MKIKGIPYIINITESENNETVKGIRPSILVDLHGGNYKGIIIAGVAAGTDTNKGKGINNADLEGLCLSGVASGVMGNLKGHGVGGIISLTGKDVKGSSVGGLASVIYGKLNGFSYGTIFNYASSSGEIAIQIGAVNNITNYDKSGTVIQIGVYNRAGSQTIPLINIRGLGKLLKKGKKN